MKFGKWLKRQIEQSLPEWRDQFVSYKELKRIVSSISVSPPPSPAGESLFVSALNAEIDKIDSFFLEQEEEFVIRHRELQEAIKAALERGSEEEVAAIRREIVDFHGEMVLLLNYSSINYIGVAKILKKYDKRAGGVRLRPPLTEAVRRQRCFLETDTVSRMVRECEAMATLLPPSPPPATPAAAAVAEEQLAAVAEQTSIFRNTVAALVTMQDVRSGSSTHGCHSLPPLTLPDSDWLRSFHFQPPPFPIPIQ